MVKRYFIYFFLLNFLNTCLFTKEIPDFYSNKKNFSSLQNEEYNSLLEIASEMLGDNNKDTSHDEDDDIDDPLKTGVQHFYHISNSFYVTPIEVKELSLHSFLYRAPKYTCYLEQDSPPPKFS